MSTDLGIQVEVRTAVAKAGEAGIYLYRYSASQGFCATAKLIFYATICTTFITCKLATLREAVIVIGGDRDKMYLSLCVCRRKKNEKKLLIIS